VMDIVRYVRYGSARCKRCFGILDFPSAGDYVPIICKSIPVHISGYR